MLASRAIRDRLFEWFRSLPETPAREWYQLAKEVVADDRVGMPCRLAGMRQLRRWRSNANHRALRCWHIGKTLVGINFGKHTGITKIVTILFQCSEPNDCLLKVTTNNKETIETLSRVSEWSEVYSQGHYPSNETIYGALYGAYKAAPPDNPLNPYEQNMWLDANKRVVIGIAAHVLAFNGKEQVLPLLLEGVTDDLGN